MTGFRPWSANSCWQKARAKKPRLSSLRSRSMTNAPFSFVSVKIMVSLLGFVGQGTGLEDELTAVEPFGVARRARFDGAKAHERPERLRREPGLRALRHVAA